MQADRKWPTMEAKEVAVLLGWKPKTFSQNKKRLIEEEGLPAPLPGGLFSRAAIERWIDTYDDRKREAVARQHGTSIASPTVHRDRSALEAKYAASNAA